MQEFSNLFLSLLYVFSVHDVAEVALSLKMPKSGGEGAMIVGVGVGTEYMSVARGKFHIKPIRRLQFKKHQEKSRVQSKLHEFLLFC